MLTVKDVEYEGGYTLLCEFSDGVRKRVDLTPLLQYPAFEELRDEKQFIQFGLDQKERLTRPFVLIFVDS